MNDIIAKLYGGSVQNPLSSTVSGIYGGGAYPRASNPDWDAGNAGDTVGGIGNTAAMGEDINWGRPDRFNASEDAVIDTPAGKYKVVMTETGYALEPTEGALRGVSPTINNFTAGKHHIGINPETGEVWYQQAKYIPSNFSQTAAAQAIQEPPPAEEGANARANAQRSVAPSHTQRSVVPSDSTYLSDDEGFFGQEASNCKSFVNRQQPDYVQAFRKRLVQSMFGDLL